MKNKILLMGLLILLLLSLSVNAAGINKAGRLIFLVTSIDYPDAAAASVAAAKTGGIVMVTEKDSLTEDLMKAIQDYNPDQVLVVGGPKAITLEVESQVNSLGYETVRIAGETRYDTASEIAKTFWVNTSKVFIVRGRGEAHADALSVVPQAALENAPILYTETDEFPDITKETIKNLKVRDIIIVGGPKAVSGEVVNELKAIGRTVEREGGEYAHDTSRAVAEKVLRILLDRGMPVDHALIAVTKNHEGLAAGQLGVETGSPVLVVPAEGVPESIKGFLKRNRIDKATVVGNAPHNGLSEEGIHVYRLRGRNRGEVQLKTHKQVRVVRKTVEKAVEMAGETFSGELKESFEKIKRNADKIADREVRLELIREKKEDIKKRHDRGEVSDEDYAEEKDALDSQEEEVEDERDEIEDEIEKEKDKIKEKVNKLTDEDITQILSEVKEELGILEEENLTLPMGVMRKWMRVNDLPKGIENVINKSIGFSRHYQEGKIKHESMKEEKKKELEARLEEHKKGKGKPWNVTEGAGIW
ncbi:MAG: cell wall-binding repeat-containing protein [Candidatus Altiarchaeota archaeon]|nr:cell wall-binding repeat-containing protein [Candidatus Altiarchaeota archaeon]